MACRVQFAHERSLVERMQGRPFALLGINGDPTIEILRQCMAQNHLNWRSWWDGPQPGPIASAWKVNRWPTIYVIDAEGVIRARDVSGKRLEEVVERLVVEAEK